MASESEMVAFLSANWTFTILTLITPARASEYASVAIFRAEAPLLPVGGGDSKVWTDVGAPPVFSAGAVGVGVGAGIAGVASTGVVVEGVGAAVVSVAGFGVGTGVAAGAGVTVGAGVGSAQAGDIATTGSDPREMTSAASSAAVFRIEFTFRPS
ncbi:hypothetical protein [Arthrobacter sp. PAMC25564]|uniref:hypothetical protein n=1 Tax=Arthrobacter sp. PAMC25564 TaxID=2565366 RepID=UPI0014458896|nr:hypothetical protein [Arthrobacter sp. PAMC25564]